MSSDVTIIFPPKKNEIDESMIQTENTTMELNLTPQ